jgi:hypothetical protein
MASGSNMGKNVNMFSSGSLKHSVARTKLSTVRAMSNEESPHDTSSPSKLGSAKKSNASALQKTQSLRSKKDKDTSQTVSEQEEIDAFKLFHTSARAVDIQRRKMSAQSKKTGSVE